MKRETLYPYGKDRAPTYRQQCDECSRSFVTNEPRSYCDDCIDKFARQLCRRLGVLR